MKPYCFVLMPFGKKSDAGGRVVAFDAVYEQVIRPALEDAGLDPLRADEEVLGGILHKPVFERLMLCDYAVADLTTANANVFYELGIRHGVRPHSTILMAVKGMRLPFDVAPLRSLFYELDEAGSPVNGWEVRKDLANRLVACREPHDDSPLYQLLTDAPRPDLERLQRLKTDSFRERVAYSQEMKDRLGVARSEGPSRGPVAVAAIEKEIHVRDGDPAIIIDILLSYRAVKDYRAMVDLVERMPGPLKRTVLVQEQLGFALNRLGRRGEAVCVLETVIDAHGPSSETYGLLGRVYKDRWEAAKASGDVAAGGYLKKAIGTYLRGFEADFRDAYPGINAVTLMEMTDPPDGRQEALMPVVRYAVQRRLAGKKPDYWDHATRLELAVLARDEGEASESLALALSQVRETWEPETTARNIKLIRVARCSRGEVCEWITRIEERLREVGHP